MRVIFYYSFVISVALAACRGSVTSPEELVSDTKTGEEYRPYYHFTPSEMWMNDPNGMVYYDNEYHLFYQHYPDSNVWGPMHWGHAVSTDMLHWEHLPIALYPDSLGYIFSGSAVVDWNNTSGFGTAEIPPLIAIYTYHDMQAANEGDIKHQTQAIAYSLDKGRSWTKYEDNPVIDNPGLRDFRDPKVFWHQETQKWILVLSAHDHVKIYASSDLKNWDFLSEFGREQGVHGGVWECPDLFPLRESTTGEEKWVLILNINPGAINGGSGVQYFVGEFDGRNFTLGETFAGDVVNEQGVWLDYGPDDYAGVTWSDIPASDGRRLFLGWMSNWAYAQVVPTYSWRSAMTVPRRLALHLTSNGYRVRIHPVSELIQLRQDSFVLEEELLTGYREIVELNDIDPSAMEVSLQFVLPGGEAKDLGIELRNESQEKIMIGFDGNQFYLDRRNAGPSAFSAEFADRKYTAPRAVESKILDMHLYFDAASVELFADEGSTMLTGIFFPSQPFTKVYLYSGNAEVKLTQGKFYGLNKIFNR